ALDALGLIPGARGVTSLAALARSGKTVLGGLRNPGAIRNGISNVRRNGIANAKKTKCGDPIDVATGEMVQQQTDVDLPGILPLTLTRTHLSSYRVGRWFGPSWASTLDQRLELDATGMCYAAEDGMLLVYPHPGEDPVLPEEGPRRPLTRTPDGGYTITDPETGRTLHFALAGDPAGLVLPLVAISERNGHRITLNYDPDGTLTQVRHSGGYHLTVDTHDGRITALRLRRGDHGSETTLVRYRYDQARYLTDVLNSSDLPLRFDYDPDGRIVRWTDRNTAWYTYTYDEHGRCVRTTGTGSYLDGNLTYHHDDPDHSVTEVTDSLGHTTRYEFNDAYQLIREVNPLGHATVSEWDRYDRLLARADPLGRTTRHTYDEHGNLTSITRPDGTQTCATYNDLRLPVIITGPDGAVWQHQYDQHGNLTNLIDPTGATTTYTYNDCGHLIAVTDALSHTHHTTTNPAGLPIAVTNPLGDTTRYDRDAFGRVSAISDPVGEVMRFGWTIEGRLAWRTLPDGATDHWTHDGEGNLVEHLDPLGHRTRISYTAFDLPAARTDPDGAQFTFAYDTELRLTTVTNPQGLTWRYDYDPADNPIRETDYNGRILTYAYDAAGQLVERTNGVGQTTYCTRDLLGNITQQLSGETVTTFAYDPAGNLIHATNPDAELAFQRDPLGRVLAETCNGHTLTNTYDPLGRRITRRTPSGADSVWEYDANGQPAALHTVGRTLRFNYDPAGREVERHLPAGAVFAQSWDANHRLTAQSLTAGGRPGLGTLISPREARLVQRRSYRYRPDGYIAAIDDHLSGLRRYDLDPVGRVRTVDGTGWTEHYAYDLAGNVTHATWPTPLQDPSTPDADTRGKREYVGTLIRHAGNIRYQHDAQGRVVLRQQKRLSVKPQTWHYTWDTDDRLTSVTTPDGQYWRYQYDPLGRRISKQRLAADRMSITEQIDFIWDDLVLAEQTYVVHPDASGETTLWDWEPNSFRPLTQSRRAPLRDTSQDWVDAQFHAIVTDLIGTPTELIDANGNLAWRSQTTLWGVTTNKNVDDTFCPFRFPGQYFDSEAALNYNYYRCYDPDGGRYGSNDPLGLHGGPNPHLYVSNPITSLDPLGLMSCRDNRDFNNRTEAFNAARDRAGIPRSQQPSKQWTVGDDPSQQYRSNYVYDSSPGAHGRYYQYETPNGPRVIAEHTSDPNAKSPHFHAGQPKDPAVRDMQGERYQQVGGKHHYYYPG
ncbi:MAG: DUF6531 domain-containing protein, partial [Pseudonocardiales bacterium]